MVRALALLTRVRLWSVLLLGAIALQAAAPIRAPLERVPGSAFSAATLDVALASSRRVTGDEAAQAQPLPAVPPVPAAAIPVRADALALAAPAYLRPDARGPPPREAEARLPDSTAPPLA